MEFAEYENELQAARLKQNVEIQSKNDLVS